MLITANIYNTYFIMKFNERNYIKKIKHIWVFNLCDPIVKFLDCERFGEMGCFTVAYRLQNCSFKHHQPDSSDIRLPHTLTTEKCILAKYEVSNSINKNNTELVFSLIFFVWYFCNNNNICINFNVLTSCVNLTVKIMSPPFKLI